MIFIRSVMPYMRIYNYKIVNNQENPSSYLKKNSDSKSTRKWFRIKNLLRKSLSTRKNFPVSKPSEKSKRKKSSNSTRMSRISVTKQRKRNSWSPKWEDKKTVYGEKLKNLKSLMMINPIKIKMKGIIVLRNFRIKNWRSCKKRLIT